MDPIHTLLITFSVGTSFQRRDCRIGVRISERWNDRESAKAYCDRMGFRNADDLGEPHSPHWRPGVASTNRRVAYDNGRGARMATTVDHHDAHQPNGLRF